MGISINNYNFDVYVDNFKKQDAKKKSFSEYLEFFDNEAIVFFCKSTGISPEDLDLAYELFQNNGIPLFREMESQQNRGKLIDCFHETIKDLLVTHTRTLEMCEANRDKLAYWIGFLTMFEERHHDGFKFNLMERHNKLSNRQIDTIDFQIKILKNIWGKWLSLKMEKKYIKQRFEHKMYNFTFVGVMFHEMMHCLGCILTGTKIYTVSLFNNNYDSNDGLKSGCGDGGHAYGLVQRGNTQGKAFKSFLISFAPLIFGFPVSLILFSQVDLSVIGLLFLWMGFSICYNSIPSKADEESYLLSRIVKKKYINPSLITKILILPYAIIYSIFYRIKFLFVIFTFIVANYGYITQYLYTLLW